MQSGHVTHQLAAILRRRTLDRKPWLALRVGTLSGTDDAKRLPRVSALRP